MKKRKIGVILTVAAALSMSMIVLAAEPTCKTTITNAGKTAMGYTSMSSASFCSAALRAATESGREDTKYASGVAGASAAVQTTSSDKYTFAVTVHYAEDADGTPYQKTTTYSY